LKYLKYKSKYNTLKTNQIGGADDIRVRLPTGQWIEARWYQKIAFKRFKNKEALVAAQYGYHREEEYKYDYNEGGYKFTITRNVPDNRYYDKIYIVRDDGTNMPIADWQDVKVFLTDLQPVNWYNSRGYQTWAYFDFVYSGDYVRHYKSRGTIGHPNNIEIPLDGFDIQIVFSLSRNRNGTIFYQKDDAGRTKVRISDIESERSAYLYIYNRLIYHDPAPIHAPVLVPAHGQGLYLPIPADVVVTQTLNDDIMCSICNDNKQNIRFIPCGHTNTCSQCYIHIQHPRECPMCRGQINSIVKYTPVEV
jgi:hypothetical protein